MVETPTRKIQSLCTNQGGEYLSSDFIEFCKRKDIHHQLTTGYYPWQNGIAERKNRYLFEGICTVPCDTLDSTPMVSLG